MLKKETLVCGLQNGQRHCYKSVSYTCYIDAVSNDEHETLKIIFGLLVLLGSKSLRHCSGHMAMFPAFFSGGRVPQVPLCALLQACQRGGKGKLTMTFYFLLKQIGSNIFKMLYM